MLAKTTFKFSNVNILNLRYLYQRKICVNNTIPSAITVATAAPFCAYLGINNQFKEKFIIAPTITEYKTFFSSPLGYNI